MSMQKNYEDTATSEYAENYEDTATSEYAEELRGHSLNRVCRRTTRMQS